MCFYLFVDQLLVLNLNAKCSDFGDGLTVQRLVPALLDHCVMLPPMLLGFWPRLSWGLHTPGNGGFVALLTEKHKITNVCTKANLGNEEGLHGTIDRET